MRKVFTKAFGIHDTIEAEQKRFVERVNQLVFPYLQQLQYYEEIFGGTCFNLGVNAFDVCGGDLTYGLAYRFQIPLLRVLTKDDYDTTLQVLSCLKGCLKEADSERVNVLVAGVLDQATVDLGIRWCDGRFYPSGAPFLDAALIEDPLDYLDRYPQEKSYFADALKALANKHYEEVVDKGYLAVESLAKAVLKNNSDLDGNRQQLVSQLKLPGQWEHIIKYCADYAHKYKRHAAKPAKTIKPQDAEAFLYLTGVIVRLVVESR